MRKKKKIEKGDLSSTSFRKRRPYSDNIYYFKIDDKFRALGSFHEDGFIVFKISDHQHYSVLESKKMNPNHYIDI